LLVVLLFQRLDFSRKLPIRVHQAAQLHEGTHDGDVDFDGARRAQDAGQHGHALFSECVRRSTDVASGRCHDL
jgi:hypothetical protein